MQRKDPYDSLEKDPDAGKDWRQEEKGTTDDSLWWMTSDSCSLHKIPLQDQGPGLITQDLLCSRVLLKWTRDRESFWRRHQKGTENAHSLVLARELYTFSISYYRKSKECLKVVKILLDPLPRFTFENNRISQKVLKKEKHVLKQDTL